VDLLHSDRVEETLDNTEDGGETPWSIDEVKAAKTLWVVVLRYGGGLLNVAVDRGDLGETNALKIHDGTAGLEKRTGLARTSWETWVGELLIFDGKVLEHALRGGDFVHGVQVDVAELLDVDWTSILKSQTLDELEFTTRRLKVYLVSLVVVLWVVFEDLGLLRVIEVANKFIETELFSPLLAVDEPTRMIVSKISGAHLLLSSEMALPHTSARRA
jgi:hypothetical protein